LNTYEAAVPVTTLETAVWVTTTLETIFSQSLSAVNQAPLHLSQKCPSLGQVLSPLEFQRPPISLEFPKQCGHGFIEQCTTGNPKHGVAVAFAANVPLENQPKVSFKI
jgi:hypothetical protein